MINEIPYVKTRLSIQMFLQFAIWGAWAPVLNVHMSNLKFTGEQIGLVYLTGPVALMIAPLIAGQIADRYFATQNYLGLSYIAAGATLIYASTADNFNSLWWLALISMIFFGPTLGLANSLCFTHMKNPQTEFAVVRLFGTIGWIAAGATVSVWMKATGRPISDCLNIGGVFAILNGLYSFTLPNTPPKGDATEKFALGKVLAMLKDPSFTIFILLCGMLLMFATSYYNFAGWFLNAGMGVEQSNVSLVMLVGQILEILTMLLLPLSLRKLGTKMTIALGIAAWGTRFAIFALGGPKELVLGAQALHGFCFAFAIAAAMIYVDKICAKDVRGSMQSFLAFATYGVGMAIGSVMFGKLVKSNTHNDVVNWQNIWGVAAIGCAVVFVGLLVAFKPREEKTESAETSGQPATA
jgi:nucleoside transporter